MGSILLVLQDGPSEVRLCSSTIRGIENRAAQRVTGHFGLHVFMRYIRLGILLQMELTSLPRNTTEDSQPSGAASMTIKTCSPQTAPQECVMITSG